MYSYKLSKQKNVSMKNYSRDELTEMTTFQLREICLREKIVNGITNNLDREEFINTILKYRGKEKTYLIDRHEEGGFERVEEALKGHLISRLPEEKKISIPAKMTIYPDVGIKKDDKYKVVAEKNILKESNVFLVNEDNKLCGILNLKKENASDTDFFLTMREGQKIVPSPNRNYNLLFLRQSDSDYMYRIYYSDKPVPPTNLEYYKIPVLDFQIRELQDTNTVLAIDFGTSNTCAGAYITTNYVDTFSYNDILNEQILLNQINYVRFATNHEHNKNTMAMPTIVYIKEAKDEENLKYAFGYEAMNIIKKNDYASKGSYYQGIKRWVNSYNQEEEIYDENGNYLFVKRGEIIRAYLQNIIKVAEHQFKCKFKKLHFTAPVKLKEQSLNMFKELLPEYEIETNYALDESLAVLYNTISNQLEKGRFIENEEYKALVIDCGGGTTDLSSCKFSMREGRISYKVDLNTTYENGDTNFGGNNITYRILQFMKIIFADYYKGNRTRGIDELIEVADTDIFRHVDKSGVQDLYSKLHEAYMEAENIIPTRFKVFENRTKDEYEKARNNYYFLWELAENMKKEFFQRTEMLRSSFGSSNEDDERDLVVTSLKKWNLSVVDRGNLKTVHQIPKVVFNLKEITKLIKGDIYDILRKFLDEKYETGELQEYSIIKLTGQSCRIDLFKEALKEFVPGKSIEFKQKKNEDNVVSELKLSCLRGTLKYLNALKTGEIEVTIKKEVPIAPYSVTALDFKREEKILICSLERLVRDTGYISKPVGTEMMEFILKDQEENERTIYRYKNNFEEYVQTTEENISQQYSTNIHQKDIDTIENNETRFFVYGKEDNWGFYVIPIARVGGNLYEGHLRYYAFENNLSQLDFFDGLK